MNDTIAAISTALGVGAISIVRVSGENAIKYVNDIFKEKDLSKVDTHTIHYGHVYDEKDIVDEVLVMVMKSPKTYTMEDVVEINCHGGIVTTNRILELLLSKGARLARPGEFTEKAFLNGRIDLIKAEGVIDLINAKTEKARKMAMNQVEGKLSEMIKGLKRKMLEISANIEVNIDYPEYEDILVMTNDMLEEQLIAIEKEIGKILKMSENSKIIKEGIKTVILGKPNVGKSSILNKLLEEDKAIVTDIAGTTRDIVEGSVNLDGIILNIIDTAGVRKTEDIIEKIGVDKSLKLIDDADLIILVFNNNDELSKEDIDLLERTKGKKRIVFVNKSDLEAKINKAGIETDDLVEGNTITNKGLDGLKTKIKELFHFDEIETSDLNYLSNARQKVIMKQVLAIVKDVKSAISDKIPIDVIAIDVKKIGELLGELTGDNYGEELVDQLFKQFCVGK